MKRSLLLVAALAVLGGAAQATPKFAQKEKKPCMFCHTVPSGGKRNLNDAGKWYDAKKTLTGFKPVAKKPVAKKPTPKAKTTPAPKHK